MKPVSIKDALENDILTGVLKMGERLNEEKIAERFQVSRTPIRESFRLLASSGLIDLIPRRGAFVKEPSITEVIEMFEVMAEQEAMCARHVANRLTDDVFEDLERACRACFEMKKSNNPDGYYFENRIFHFTLYDGSGNKFLAKEAKKLHSRLQPFRRLQLQSRNRLSQSNSEHEEILDAIKNAQPERAAKLARDHVIIQGEKVGTLLAALSG